LALCRRQTARVEVARSQFKQFLAGNGFVPARKESVGNVVHFQAFLTPQGRKPILSEGCKNGFTLPRHTFWMG